MFGLTLTSNEKVLIAAGGGLVAVAVLGPLFLGGSVQALTQRDDRAEKRLEKQIAAAEEKGRRARQRADQVEEKALEKANRRIAQLEAQLEAAKAAEGRARTPAVAERARKKAEATEKRLDHIEDIQAKLEGGEIKGSELRELMASGALKVKNPTGFAAAQAESAQFHGEPGEVLRLSESDRCGMPEYVTVLGKLEELSYRPSGESEKRQTIYDHDFGDRGPYLPAASGRPLLVADPDSGRLAIVQGNSPARFDPLHGIIG